MAVCILEVPQLFLQVTLLLYLVLSISGPAQFSVVKNSLLDLLLSIYSLCEKDLVRRCLQMPFQDEALFLKNYWYWFSLF